MSDPGRRIVAQGVEYRGEVMRTWSRWDTGAVTWEDTKAVPCASPTGLQGFAFLFLGSGRGGGPPRHVKMVETAPLLERVGREAPTTDPDAPQQKSIVDRR